MSFSNVALTQKLGRLHNETPYVHFEIVFDGMCGESCEI